MSVLLSVRKLKKKNTHTQELKPLSSVLIKYINWNEINKKNKEKIKQKIKL